MQTTTVFRTLLLSALLGVGAVSVPAYAQINISIGIAPPAPQYEAIPSMAPGYVWAPGYWGWSGDRHIWMRGRPIMQRTGYLWEPDRWEQRGSQYYRQDGRWVYDRHDIPQKFKKAKHEKKGNKHDR